MTIIHPHKTLPFVHIFLMILAGVLVILSVWLVVLYNQSVNLDHNISSLKTQIKNTETETAELKDRIFTLLDTQTLSRIAETEGLIKEDNPKYLNVPPVAIPAIALSGSGSPKK